MSVFEYAMLIYHHRPGCLNSLTGIITTLISVYSAQGSNWSITARVTIIVTGASTVVTAILFVIYNYWVLQRVKSSHTREMDMERHRQEGEDGEGLVEKIERKVMEPGLEPGSVV